MLVFRKIPELTCFHAITTAARALLYRKNEKDLKFLNLVVRRGLEEHPYSVGLLMLQIKLLRCPAHRWHNPPAMRCTLYACLGTHDHGSRARLSRGYHITRHVFPVLTYVLTKRRRFVFRNGIEASAQEKIVQQSHTKLGITDAYILYALMRKATQDKASTSIGQDEVRAIDLMEYDAGATRAFRSMRPCGLSHRFFSYASDTWRDARANAGCTSHFDCTTCNKD